MYYAIFDAARLEEMPARLFELEDEPEYISLFFGTSQEELFDVAPYLIRLEPNSPFLAWWMDEGLGQSWGIFFTSDADIDELLTHFQGLLKVQDPEGKELYFRYYDPRVLRVFLPTCEAGELGQMFGPVESFLVEDKQAKFFLRFIRTEGMLETDKLFISSNIAL